MCILSSYHSLKNCLLLVVQDVISTVFQDFFIFKLFFGSAKCVRYVKEKRTVCLTKCFDFIVNMNEINIDTINYTHWFDVCVRLLCIFQS